MTHRLHTLALAAACLAAAAAQAQTAEGSANVTTQASGSGSLTQTGNGAGANARQSLLVAATEAQANLGSSTLTLVGTVAADALQSRTGTGGNGSGLQRLSVGGASGELQLRTATTEGRLLAPVVQNLQSDNGLQHIGVATLNNAFGGSVRAVGTLTRGGVRQDLTGGSLAQRVLVGSADGVNVTDATLDGFLAARVDQVGQGPVGEQTLSVGSAQSSGGASVSAGGQFFGSLSQQQAGSVGTTTQRVEIGSVRGAGDAARLFASGRADAQVTQTLAGTGGVQDLTVGSAINRGAGNVFTVGDFRGRLDQSGSGDRALQRVDIGSAIAGSGNVSTQATVDAEIAQSSTAAGAGQLLQTVAVGTVNGTLASAQTRASLEGRVVQTADAGSGVPTQSVAIGSVKGSTGLVARTDAAFSGTLAQTTAQGGGSQAIAIGSVGR
ncbi:MAG: hypothetical protein U1F56_05170 [Rubrivivax sp.]